MSCYNNYITLGVGVDLLRMMVVSLVIVNVGYCMQSTANGAFHHLQT